MIQVADDIRLDDRDIEISFVRASGPGGQNVNKVATAVQLRFDVRNASGMPPGVKQRAIHLAGTRVSSEGVLIIDARRFRTQERNRQDAIDRLIALLRKAATPPRRRKKTRLPAASRERRLDDKRRRSKAKETRRGVRCLDD